MDARPADPGPSDTRLDVSRPDVPRPTGSDASGRAPADPTPAAGTGAHRPGEGESDGDGAAAGEPGGGLRAQTLDAAARLLGEEGPGALTVRRIAAEAGCSTRVIYHYFGGKDGIVDALYQEGFGRLNAALRAVPHTADPLADLRGISQAYRAIALRHPTYYEVMFSRPVPGFRPSAESRVVSESTYQIFVQAVQRCLDAGAVAPGVDAASFAHLLWATGHGLIMLQLDELTPGGELGDRRYQRALDLVVHARAADPAQPAQPADPTDPTGRVDGGAGRTGATGSTGAGRVVGGRDE